ncbi:uncharacterized protein C8orf48 homolog [Tenrec ecaudatus]|uniref:uncharacterized protein C8orf48 homolog n=1 Tax=Tenrec ecaudatus TaxID=94439 RepID=UPI003F5A5674
MSDFSSEALSSFADEVKSSGSFIPSTHASGNKPESGKRATSLELHGKRSELAEFKINEKLRRQWTNLPKSKESNSVQNQPDTKLQKEITVASDQELKALQSFCTVKINLIYHRGNPKEVKGSRSKKMPLRLDGERPEMDAQKCTVPAEIVNRIYFKNVRATLKEVSTVKQHISSECHNCNRKRAELAQSAFLRQKKTFLESLLLQQKIDEHLHTRDFLTLIGETHKCLPRLSDDPGLIWKRLREKSLIGCASFEKPATQLV